MIMHYDYDHSENLNFIQIILEKRKIILYFYAQILKCRDVLCVTNANEYMINYDL